MTESGLGGERVLAMERINDNPAVGFIYTLLMTSLVADNAKVLTPIEKERFILADRNGFPLNGQIPRTTQVYGGTGNETITINGSNNLLVAGALVGTLTINLTSSAKVKNRQITIHVRGGVGQIVTVNFPVAPYVNYDNGAAGTITTKNIAVSANNQKMVIEFTDTYSYIN
jgi:hypothetical protein